MSPKVVNFYQKIMSEFYLIVASLWKKLEKLKSVKTSSFAAYTAK